MTNPTPLSAGLDIAAALSLVADRTLTLDHRPWEKETGWPAPWRCRLFSKWLPDGRVVAYGSSAAEAIQNAAAAAAPYWTLL